MHRAAPALLATLKGAHKQCLGAAPTCSPAQPPACMRTSAVGVLQADAHTRFSLPFFHLPACLPQVSHKLLHTHYTDHSVDTLPSVKELEVGNVMFVLLLCSSMFVCCTNCTTHSVDTLPSMKILELGGKEQTLCDNWLLTAFPHAACCNGLEVGCPPLPLICALQSLHSRAYFHPAPPYQHPTAPLAAPMQAAEHGEGAALIQNLLLATLLTKRAPAAPLPAPMQAAELGEGAVAQRAAQTAAGDRR